jgi:hypothetical protein
VPDFLFAAPALPLDEAGKYVAGAYIVFLVLIVIYVAIMASKLGRMEKELRELAGFAEARAGGGTAAPGREAEEAAGEPQPPTGSDRNLTPSESVGGPAEPVQGVPDV